MSGYIRCGGGASGKTSFVWSAGYLSKGMNFENTGKIKFETLTQNISGQINIYGTNNPNIITNNTNQGVTLLDAFVTTSAGNVAEKELDKTYPYIVLYSIYSTNGWGADVRITI